MKIFLYGIHAKRTPFAYSAYKKLAVGQFEYVSTPDQADFLVFGFSKDIRDNLEAVSAIISRKPNIKLVVLSEEPLWDTLWSGDYRNRRGSIGRGGSVCEYTFLNHFTTDIYQFDSHPYFVTTSDDYFVRYANQFKRNAGLSGEEIRRIWKQAPIHQAYFTEKRTGPQYEVKSAEQAILGLCNFRTDVAESAQGQGVLRVGQGWGDAVRRQALPDWHLDKLATLDKNTFIVSGIENTHQHEYITEKIFDAYAVLGIPLYVADSEHAVNRLVPQGSYINLYGLTAAQAIEKIRAFEPDNNFLASYLEAQSRLARLFSSPQSFWAERTRILHRIEDEFRHMAPCTPYKGK